MSDYQKGFVEGLQAACILGRAKLDAHMRNMDDASLSEEDHDDAFTCVGAVGNLISDIKVLGSQVHRNAIDPSKIATANGEPYWWATEDGKGCN